MPSAVVSSVSSVSDKQLARALNASAFYLLLLVLMVSPLLWGSVRPWAWYPMQLGIFLALTLYGIGSATSSPANINTAELPPKLIVAPLVLFLIFVALQTLPLPHFILNAVAPGSANYYSYVPGGAASISVDRGATLQDLLLYCAYVSAFLVLYATLNSRARMRQLVYCLIAVAVFQAVFGIHAMYNQLFVVPKEWLDGHFSVARGTYINPNHYASYLMTAGALMLGLIYANVLKHWEGIRRLRSTDVIAELGTSTGVLIMMLAIVVAGAAYSGSRGAPGASLLALFLVLAAGLFTRRRGEVRIVVPTIIIVAIALFWLGAAQFVEKALNEGVAIASRLHLWALSVDVVKDHWLTGSGVGTYALIFSGYRDGSLRPLHYDSPHNDYLETLVEVGLIGSVLLLLFMGYTLYSLFKAYLERHSSFYRGMLFGSIIATVGFLVHSLVDFNFRIPANALLFFCICALGLRAAQLPSEERN